MNWDSKAVKHRSILPTQGLRALRRIWKDLHFATLLGHFGSHLTSLCSSNRTVLSPPAGIFDYWPHRVIWALLLGLHCFSQNFALPKTLPPRQHQERQCGLCGQVGALWGAKLYPFTLAGAETPMRPGSAWGLRVLFSACTPIASA